ncbi:lysozyme inhibitor LprI family protein [Pseudomonas saliphila]|uniref:lysozyme inhibitor LprI family protein n=1 Tax=Pseudomonas saliphila TaxID=2586906 RepID=UPI0015B386F9|nr:lysozyme inhibitor LprI family protein [Pseudomonas saliphila]
MGQMKSVIAGSMLVLSSQAMAGSECGQFISDADIIDCVTQESERADARLDETLRALLDELESHPQNNPHALETRELLVHAQDQWAAFRKTDCDARFALNQGGSIRIPAYQLCMTDHAQKREQQLKGFLD